MGETSANPFRKARGLISDEVHGLAAMLLQMRDGVASVIGARAPRFPAPLLAIPIRI
jgi:hypothetical protein